MGKQSDIFLKGEGAAWITRNKDKSRHGDPILKLIKRSKFEPKTAVEVGCGDGWRLRELSNLYDTDVRGLDPGLKEKKGVIVKGTAKDLSQIPDDSMDLVIFGFCLYLVDREDLFRVVYEADRVLKVGGRLIIHDFMDGTYAKPYKHKDGVLSYHHPYVDMWLGNPQYETVEVIYDEGEKASEAAFMIRKMSVEEAYEVKS